MEDEKQTFKLGSTELNKELESKYYKFSLGQPENIEVPLTQEVEKRIQEFEDPETKEVKVVAKYDLHILVNGDEKLWSVSNKVLTTINTYIDETQKFKIILRSKSYEVVPLGIKE